jgi:hypothetical protein
MADPVGDAVEKAMKDMKENDRREKPATKPSPPKIVRPTPVAAEDYRNPVRKVVESPPNLDEMDLHVGGKQVERESDSPFDKMERGDPADPKAQTAAVVVNKFWHHGTLHRKGDTVMLTEEELVRARNHVDVTRPPSPPARHLDTDHPSAKTKDR